MGLQDGTVQYFGMSLKIEYWECSIQTFKWLSISVPAFQVPWCVVLHQIVERGSHVVGESVRLRENSVSIGSKREEE